MPIERSIEKLGSRTLEKPDYDEPDPVRRERRHAFREVPERDGRVLRVVYARSDDVLRIITVFLDPEKAELMKAKYDAESDALYVRFLRGPSSKRKRCDRAS